MTHTQSHRGMHVHVGSQMNAQQSERWLVLRGIAQLPAHLLSHFLPSLDSCYFTPPSLQLHQPLPDTLTHARMVARTHAHTHTYTPHLHQPLQHPLVLVAADQGASATWGFRRGSLREHAACELRIRLRRCQTHTHTHIHVRFLTTFLSLFILCFSVSCFCFYPLFFS